MPDVWAVKLTGEDRRVADKLAARRAALGLASRHTETIRAALRLALTADSETLARGTISDVGTSRPPNRRMGSDRRKRDRGGRDGPAA